MRTPLIVPDASVLLKWVLPTSDETDVEQALSLRSAIAEESVRALVPAHWLYEVANTIARRFPEQATSWLSAFLRFGFDAVPASYSLIAKALELTRRHDVSFYDAAYHAVAIVHGGVFVTADTRYISRVASSGSILALREWNPPRPTTRRGSRR